MIFVVDDNRDLRETLSDLLSLEGHAVRCAADGGEAVRSLSSSGTRPDLILLDIVMPVLDGWGVLTEISKYPHLVGVPVVIMSGLPEIAQRAKESGAVAVVSKPVEFQTLLQIIDHCLG